MSVSFSNQTCLASQITNLNLLFAAQQSINDRSFSVIHPRISNDRLFQNESGEVFLIPKTPAEVFGEVVLRPLIDAVINIKSRVFSIFPTSSVSKVKNSCWTFGESVRLPKLPQLIPMASAQTMPKTNDIVEIEISPDAQSQERTEPIVTKERMLLMLNHLGYSFNEVDMQLTREVVSDDPENVDNQLVVFTDMAFEKILSSYKKIKWSGIDKSLLVQLKDTNGLNLFQSAVDQGEKGCVEKLLPIFRGTDALSAVDSTGKNALHFAAIKNHTALIPYLSGPIDIQAKDNTGLTPLQWAIQEGHSEAVKSLLKYGAKLKTAWESPDDGIKFYPLSMAVAVGNLKTIDVLLQEDNLKQIDFLQDTPRIGTIFHIAIHANHAPMLKYFLETHYDKVKGLLEINDPYGRTPLQLAAYLGDLNAVYLLSQHGAALNKGHEEEGGTAVHYAADGEQYEAIKYLYDLGANLETTNDKGETPIILIRDRNTPKAKECKSLLRTLPSIKRKKITQPPDFTRRPPVNLVFQGGGPKGIAYVGALRQIEQLEAFNKVKRVAGTSAGAIAASLLSVGYRSKELEIFLSMDFTEFFDVKGDLEEKALRKTIELTGSSETLEEKVKALLKFFLREYWQGWKTLLHPKKRAERFFSDLFSLTGLCHGEKLRLWIEKLIKNATGISHCTFEELNRLIHKQPNKYKELHVYATRITPEKDIIRFSYSPRKKYDNSTNAKDDFAQGAWNDLIISDAVRASVSIPGIFEPHTLHFKHTTGLRQPLPKIGKFIDGGLIKNFPIDAFDGHKYQEDNKLRYGTQTNRRTLGFSLSALPEASEEQIKAIDSIDELMEAVIFTYLEAQEILIKSEPHNQGRMITIPTNVGLLDFNIDPQTKREMIQNGTNAVNFFFNQD